MIDTQDTARLSVNLGSMKVETMRFLDTHFETKKQELALHIEKAIAEFDIEKEIRRRVNEAIEEKVEKIVELHVRSALGWDSPLTLEIERKVKEQVIEKLRGTEESES